MKQRSSFQSITSSNIATKLEPCTKESPVSSVFKFKKVLSESFFSISFIKEQTKQTILLYLIPTTKLLTSINQHHFTSSLAHQDSYGTSTFCRIMMANVHVSLNLNKKEQALQFERVPFRRTVCTIYIFDLIVSNTN